MPPQIYLIFVLPPRDHPFPPLDWNHTPTSPLMAAPKAGTNTSTRHRVQQPEQPKGRTTGEQPAVASSRDRFLREILHEEQNNIWNQILRSIWLWVIIPKHTNLCKLENQTRRNTTAVVGGRWYITWYKEPWSGANYSCCKRGAFYFFISSFTFGYFLTYMMGTPCASTNVRVLTVVLPALLAGANEFCLVCLVCGLCCCSSFWSVCVLSFLMLGSFFLPFPSCSRLRGKEEGTPFLSVVVVGLPLSLFCNVRSPSEVLVSWLRVLLLLYWKFVTVKKGNSSWV